MSAAAAGKPAIVVTAADLAPEAQAQALDRIRQDALRAGHVLNQLLALARASRAELDGATGSVDLAALARSRTIQVAIAPVFLLAGLAIATAKGVTLP